MEGHDHLPVLQRRRSRYRELFGPYFRYVATRMVNYTIGQQRNFARREVFWRCSDSRESLYARRLELGGRRAEPAGRKA